MSNVTAEERGGGEEDAFNSQREKNKPRGLKQRSCTSATINGAFQRRPLHPRCRICLESETICRVNERLRRHGTDEISFSFFFQSGAAFVSFGRSCRLDLQEQVQKKKKKTHSGRNTENVFNWPLH